MESVKRISVLFLLISSMKARMAIPGATAGRTRKLNCCDFNLSEAGCMVFDSLMGKLDHFRAGTTP